MITLLKFHLSILNKTVKQGIQEKWKLPTQIQINLHRGTSNNTNIFTLGKTNILYVIIEEITHGPREVQDASVSWNNYGI